MMKKVIFIGALMLLLGTAAPAFADQTPAFCTGGVCSYIPLEPLPCTDKNGQPQAPGSCQTGTSAFPGLLASAFKLLVTLGALFAVVMVVISGIAYMLSETPLKMEQAKDRAWAALKGLLILGAAWLIIYTVNPKLLNFDLFNTDLRQYANRVAPANTDTVTGKNVIVTPSSASYNAALTNCENSGGKLHIIQVDGSDIQTCDKQTI